MKKTQVMHWRHLKRFADLEDTLLLFRSGNFCRTFEEDAVFLSCVCGFQILVKWGYKMVGFPLSAEEKYLMLLKKRGYSYRLFSVKDTIPQVVKSFEGTAPLACSEEDAISRFKQLSVPTSPEKPPVPSENSDFKAFLQELVVLLQKYSV